MNEYEEIVKYVQRTAKNDPDNTRSEDNIDHLLSEMTNIISSDNDEEFTDLFNTNDSFLTAAMEKDPILMQLATLIFEKFREHDYISLLDDLMPILGQVLLYQHSEERSIIQARYNIKRYMKQAFMMYDIICVPKVELGTREFIDEPSVDLTDVLIYNKEDL